MVVAEVGADHVPVGAPGVVERAAPVRVPGVAVVPRPGRVRDFLELADDAVGQHDADVLSVDSPGDSALFALLRLAEESGLEHVRDHDVLEPEVREAVGRDALVPGDLVGPAVVPPAERAAVHDEDPEAGSVGPGLGQLDRAAAGAGQSRDVVVDPERAALLLEPVVLLLAREAVSALVLRIVVAEGDAERDARLLEDLDHRPHELRELLAAVAPVDVVAGDDDQLRLRRRDRLADGARSVQASFRQNTGRFQQARQRRPHHRILR